MTRFWLILSTVMLGAWGPGAAAQSSSLIKHPGGSPSGGAVNPGAAATSAEGTSASGNASFFTVLPQDRARPSTRTLERVSLIAITAPGPRKFKPHDLLTIIVRQQKDYKAKGQMDTEKAWDVSGKLSEWFRFYPRNHLGTDRLSNGEPGFKFNFDNKLETDGKNQRRDAFTTRITATIIDVKPNGVLVFEARLREEHDEEVIDITLTGKCRSEDVTPDNTILSTQIADLVLVEQNDGAVRDAMTRGWVPKILDWAKPF